MTDLPSCVYAGQHITPIDGMANISPVGIGSPNSRVSVTLLPRQSSNLCTMQPSGLQQHHHQFAQMPPQHHHHHHHHPGM